MLFFLTAFVFWKVLTPVWKDQRVPLKYCFPLYKSTTAPYQMFHHALKEDGMTSAQVFEWFWHFKQSEVSVEEHACSGRSSISRSDEKTEKLRQKYHWRSSYYDWRNLRRDRSELQLVSAFFWLSICIRHMLPLNNYTNGTCRIVVCSKFC